jgi:hypothetical protein
MMMKQAIPAVLAALLMLATSASANTQWFDERQAIAEGETVEVATSGPKITLSLKLPKQTRITIPCPASGPMAFWNSPTNGLDETRAISFSCPEGTTVTPILPWSSTLLESELPLHDKWENVALQLTYNRMNYGTFTGSLDTTVGDVDPVKDEENHQRDELDNYLVFRGGLKKSLAGPNQGRLWFSGVLHLGGKGSRVTDESGFWMRDGLVTRPDDYFSLSRVEALEAEDLEEE